MNIFIPITKEILEDELCPVCNGSGQGRFDGSSCSACFGWGMKINEQKRQRIVQHKAELLWEEQQWP